MNVQKMNSKEEKIDEIVALQLLEEIEQNNNVSQRNLSNKLGIALGLVNTYIKLLVKKGYIRIANFPKSRYTYLLTPEGMAEKSRLVYKHLSYFNNLFKTVRKDTLNLFQQLESKGVKKVAFLGVDDVAEIAYISLQETKIALIDVYDDTGIGKNFFKFKIKSLEDLKNFYGDRIILTTLKKAEALLTKAEKEGIDLSKIEKIIG